MPATGRNAEAEPMLDRAMSDATPFLFKTEEGMYVRSMFHAAAKNSYNKEYPYAVIERTKDDKRIKGAAAWRLAGSPSSKWFTYYDLRDPSDEDGWDIFMVLNPANKKAKEIGPLRVYSDWTIHKHDNDKRFVKLATEASDE